MITIAIDYTGDGGMTNWRQVVCQALRLNPNRIKIRTSPFNNEFFEVEQIDETVFPQRVPLTYLGQDSSRDTKCVINCERLLRELSGHSDSESIEPVSLPSKRSKK